jgi:hypothetical protein
VQNVSVEKGEKVGIDVFMVRPIVTTEFSELEKLQYTTFSILQTNIEIKYVLKLDLRFLDAIICWAT